jgi:hypothetical protein
MAAMTIEQQRALALAKARRRRAEAQQSTGPRGVAMPPAGLQPGSREYADWAAEQARAGKTLPQVSDPRFTETESSALDPFVQGVTFGFGDELRGAVQGGLAAVQGGDFGSAYDQVVDESRNALNEERRVNPIGSLAAEVAGAIPTSVAAGGQLAARGANVLQRAVSGGLIGAGQGAVYGAGAAEGDLADRAQGALTSGLISGGIGGAVPVIGAGLTAGTKAVGQRVGRGIRAVTNPAEEASRQVGTAVTRDLSANPTMTMNAADEAIARQSGLPLINVDRGGETTRALARSVANQSPEARAIIERTVDDRFSTQAPRAVELIKRLTGGAADDLAYQEQLRKTAELTNRPRYRAAENAPSAQRVFTPELQELMQSPAIQRAIDKVGETGKDLAVISGQVPVQNPFRKGSDGIWRVVQKADGTVAVPNLRFWDQVKRNLDPQIEQAQRGANPSRYQVSILKQLKDKLVSSLDSVVPEYQVARQGAASFFGAEDALEAGKKFASQPRAIPEATKAFGAFTQEERQAFATGYASELIDKIKASGDRRNVIQQMFGSPAAREMNELVFGAGKARELEAFVRVETLADKLRGAMGNSTTARQLMELGIGGGAGFALSGDWQGAAAGAVVAKGGRYLGQKVDAKVMEEVAKLLTADNPQALQRAVVNAAASPKWMAALDQLEVALETPVRGALTSVVSR